MKTSELQVFDAAEYLDSEEAIAAYLEAAAEDGDTSEITRALGVVARARGMSLLARETGITREALYKALNTQGNPSLDTLAKVVKAFGLRIAFIPQAHEEEEEKPVRKAARPNKTVTAKPVTRRRKALAA